MFFVNLHKVFTPGTDRLDVVDEPVWLRIRLTNLYKDSLAKLIETQGSFRSSNPWKGLLRELRFASSTYSGKAPVKSDRQVLWKIFDGISDVIIAVLHTYFINLKYDP